jgi:hypothetical protein
VGFATLPTALCLLEFRGNFSARIVNAFMAANLLVPSFLVAGNSGVVMFRGLISWPMAGCPSSKLRPARDTLNRVLHLPD